MHDRDPRSLSAASPTESTASLLQRVRSGDAPARERLVRLYLPILQRWASGRLPMRARGVVDTDDLVQVSLLKALDKIEGFEPRREGAFLAYLRRILHNQIIDQIRRADRRPRPEELNDNLEHAGPSPLDEAIGRETVDVYEAALARLTPQQQEAVVLRLEMGFTHQQVADAVGCPSANAARMLVARALVRLAEAMDEERPVDGAGT